MKHYLFFQTKCSVNWKKCSTTPWKYLLRIEAMVEVGVWCFPYWIFSPTTHRFQAPGSRLLTGWLIEQKPLHQAPDWMCLYLTYRVISLVYSHIWVFTYWLFSRSLSRRQGIFFVNLHHSYFHHFVINIRPHVHWLGRISDSRRRNMGFRPVIVFMFRLFLQSARDATLTDEMCLSQD